MTRKRKVYFILIIVILGSIVIIDKILLWRNDGGNNPAETMSETVLNDNNSIRRKFGVPQIEEGWVLSKSDSNRMYWTSRVKGVFTSKPFHLAKTVRLERGIPVSEEDDFHFEASDSLAYRLVLFYDYEGQETMKRRSNEFIIYYRGRYPPSSKKVVTNEFADSVLRKWSSESAQVLIPTD